MGSIGFHRRPSLAHVVLLSAAGAPPTSPVEALMTLQERLDAIREHSKTRIPAEARAVMQRSIDDLRASGIMRRIAAVGSSAPEFTLPNAAGQPVRLSEARARGPVVLSFYRGRW